MISVNEKYGKLRRLIRRYNRYIKSKRMIDRHFLYSIDYIELFKMSVHFSRGYDWMPKYSRTHNKREREFIIKSYQ